MEAYCFICSHPLPEETEAVEEYETLSICHACKVLFLEGHDSNLYHSPSRRHYSRSRNLQVADSVEEIFSHRFSRLINQVRQNLLDASTSGSELRYRQSNDVASITAPSIIPNALLGRVQMRHRALSDNASDLDSIWGESDANASISGFGAFSVDSAAVSITGHGLYSDASFDGRSLADGDAYAQEEDERHIGSDTDIDPMHAGLDHWDLDEEEEDDDDEEGDWGEADVVQDAMDQINIWVRGATNNNEENAQIGLQEGGSSQGDRERDMWNSNVSADHYRDADMSSLFMDFLAVRTEVDAFIGNPDDYLGEEEFERLLNQLTETEGAPRGAPPAAESILKSLPQIIISEEHGVVICAVCKDLLITGAEANQLPCTHLYHPSCILPWLSTRNSCPVCRYELLTDDKDYEEGKRISSSLLIRELQQLDSGEDDSSAASEVVDERSNMQWQSIGAGVRVVDNDEELIGGDIIDQMAERANITDEIATPNGINPGHRPRGWLFFAAAPIVSIVSIVLVLWFKNPTMEGRLNRIIRQTDHTQLDRSPGSSTTVNNNGGRRNRGWWSLF